MEADGIYGKGGTESMVGASGKGEFRGSPSELIF
jgi:hypothetical protein